MSYYLSNNDFDVDSISNVEVKDIPKDMCLYSFIGRTIEALVHTGTGICIRFTDGSIAYIENKFPIHVYGREVFHRHEDKGELNLLCGHAASYDNLLHDSEPSLSLEK